MKSVHPVFSDEMKEIVRSFVIETQEIFDDLNNHLLRLEQASDTRPIIDEIFRAVHTVKGTCSFLSLDQLTLLTHRFEDVLNLLRGRKVTIQPSMMDVMFAAFDMMNILLQQVLDGSIEEVPMDGLLHDLEILAGGGRSGDGAVSGGQVHASILPSYDRRPEDTGSPGFQPSSISSAPLEQSTPAEEAATRSRTSETLRIHVDRIDDLIGLAGEMAAGRDQIRRLIQDLDFRHGGADTIDALSDAVARLSAAADAIQSAVVQIRMVPVGTVFSRFHRVARDLARELGKDVELQVEGADVELDRSMVDEIADPLLHLVRNAIDHGIEAPRVRLQAGKPVHGRIALRAEPVADSVLLTIEDDGPGIDVAALRRRAAASGFGSAHEIETMSPREIQNLIFRPGFTAHKKANRISGRGVGLDVVKTVIERLGGSVSVDSQPGRYTRFSVRLPRKSIVQRCVLVDCGESSFAVPSSAVGPILNESDAVGANYGRVVRLANRDIPLLDPTFRFNEASEPPTNRRIVILRTAEGSLGLIVDRVRSEQDLIVKSGPSGSAGREVFAGSANVGAGRTVNVLDVARLLHLVLSNRPTDESALEAAS